MKNTAFTCTYNFQLHDCIFKVHYSTTNFLWFPKKLFSWIVLLPVIYYGSAVFACVLPLFFLCLARPCRVVACWISKLLLNYIFIIHNHCYKYRFLNIYVRMEITLVVPLLVGGGDRWKGQFPLIAALKITTVSYMRDRIDI